MTSNIIEHITLSEPDSDEIELMLIEYTNTPSGLPPAPSKEVAEAILKGSALEYAEIYHE